jgi:hypothetical protein
LLGSACALQAMDALRAGEKLPPSLMRLLEEEQSAEALPNEADYTQRAIRSGEKLPLDLVHFLLEVERLLEEEQSAEALPNEADYTQRAIRLGEKLPADLAQFLLEEERERNIKYCEMEYCEGCLKPYPEGTGFATDDDVYLCPACWDEVIHDPDCAVGWFERLRARLSRMAAWLRSLPERIEAWQPTERQITICDLWVKTAVICIALYLAFEVGRAFLPGGAASTVLFGGTK